MGLEPEYLQFIDECAKATIVDLRGKKMLELGNQHLASSLRRLEGKTGKKFYTRRGVAHTSIDLNGKDGAIALDLGKTQDRPEWKNYFDIITNAGTTEHVEPLEAQYECFGNLHRWLKVGGIAVHIVPCVEELEANGSWKGHCNNYYSTAFFDELAAQNGYRTIASRRIKNLLCVCLSKEDDRPFSNDRSRFLQHIARRDGGIVYAGINDGIPPSERVSASNGIPAGAADILAIGFGTTVTMWGLGYAARLPAIDAPAASILLILLLAVVAGGWVAGRYSPRGTRGGAYAGLVAGVLNLLVMGGLVSNPVAPNAVVPSAVLWLPGSIAISGLLGALGGWLGARTRRRTGG